jgi:CspA family cold shock protein
MGVHDDGGGLAAFFEGELDIVAVEGDGNACHYSSHVVRGRYGVAGRPCKGKGASAKNPVIPLGHARNRCRRTPAPAGSFKQVRGIGRSSHAACQVSYVQPKASGGGRLAFYGPIHYRKAIDIWPDDWATSLWHCRAHVPSLYQYRRTGTVKWYNETKGYGFIQPDNGGKDIFVHATALERAGMRGLREGQKISYELQTDQRTGRASAVNLQNA